MRISISNLGTTAVDYLIRKVHGYVRWAAPWLSSNLYGSWRLPPPMETSSKTPLFLFLLFIFIFFFFFFFFFSFFKIQKPKPFLKLYQTNLF
jgi:hypothetical protein